MSPRKRAPLDVRAVVLCDDVRREDNGKELLIGVYSNDIIIAEVPTQLALNLWLVLYIAEVGQHDLEIRVTAPGGGIVFSGEGSLNALSGRVESSLRIGPMPFTFQAPGDLIVSIRFPGRPWRVVRTAKVRLRS